MFGVLAINVSRNLKTKHLPCPNYQLPMCQQLAFFGRDSTESAAKVRNYLSSIGINVEQHSDLIQYVRQFVGETTDITVSTLTKAFAEADLLELSRSIKAQQNKRQRKAAGKARMKRDVMFCLPSKENVKLTWKFGDSLLGVAQSPQAQELFQGLEQMEGPCGGKMRCSTCHVYLDPITYQALPPPVEEELDMLDLAFEPRETSRLGCQVKLDNALAASLGNNHEIEVTLPADVNHEWEQ